MSLRKCGRTAGSLRKLVCIAAVLVALPDCTSRTAVTLDQLIQVTAVLVALRERRGTAVSLVDLVGVDIRKVVGRIVRAASHVTVRDRYCHSREDVYAKGDEAEESAGELHCENSAVSVCFG
jgi:hypothetical protein